MRGDRAIGWNYAGSILFDQACAHVGVQSQIQWTHLLPEAFDIGAESIRRHVVACTPRNSDIFESDLAGTLIGKFGEARVTLAHGRAYFVPADPDVFQLLRVTAIGHDALDSSDIQTLFRFAT